MSYVRGDLKTRLLGHVRVTASGCWEWTGHRNAGGYGTIWSGHDTPKMMLAHRASWRVHVGQIPDGMDVCHRCDNPPCINPEHLFAGTVSANIKDCAEKGRWGPPRTGSGERHPNAKISDADVLAIRRLRAAGLKQKDIAAQYRIAQSRVSQLTSGGHRA